MNISNSFRKFILSLLIVLPFMGACSSTAKDTVNLVKLYPNVKEIELAMQFCDVCNADKNCPKKLECNDQARLTISIYQSAISAANLEVIQFLTEKRNIPVDFLLTEDKDTPLISTVYYPSPRHFKVAKYLVDKGADVNHTKPIQGKNTALNTSLWKRNFQAAILLLANDARTDIRPYDSCGLTVPLMWGDNNLQKNPNEILREGFFEIMPYIPSCCASAWRTFYSKSDLTPGFRRANFLQVCPTPETYKDPKIALQKILNP
jgi:Ankyrin repeats (many copies)